MVCPDCGHDQFYTEHHASIRRMRKVSDSGYVEDGEDVVQDLDRDYDALTCDDCGAQWQEDDLMTEDAYNDGDRAGCDFWHGARGAS